MTINETPMQPLKRASSRTLASMGEASPYRGRSPSEREDMRRALLMQAGLVLFGTQGLCRTTLGELCCHARLAVRYFQRSFASREALFEAVYAQQHGLLMSQLQTALHDRCALNRTPPMEVLLRAYFDFLKEDPRRVRIMLVDAPWLRYSGTAQCMNGASQLACESGQAWRSVSQLVSVACRQAHDAQPHDHDLLETLVGMTQQSALRWAQTGFSAPADLVVRNNMLVWRQFRCAEPTLAGRADALSTATT